VKFINYIGHIGASGKILGQICSLPKLFLSSTAMLVKMHNSGEVRKILGKREILRLDIWLVGN